MSRLDVPSYEAMDDLQRKVAGAILSGPRGSTTGIKGLMGLWLHNAGFAEKAEAVGEFLRFKGSLPGNIRELCILLVAKEWRCNYEWHIHAPIAKSQGLSDNVINSILAGQKPEVLSLDEQALYTYVTELLYEKRVSEDAFRSILDLYGSAGIIELAGIIGHYIIGAATLNAVEFDLPGNSKGVFDEL